LKKGVLKKWGIIPYPQKWGMEQKINYFEYKTEKPMILKQILINSLMV
jgi:hypothetical protein